MVTKQGEIELKATLSEAFRRSAEALNVIGGKVRTEDPSTRRIEGTTSMSLTSWGENILIDVTGVDDRAVVHITSSSSWPTTLFDFGKNAGNVQRFLDWLGR